VTIATGRVGMLGLGRMGLPIAQALVTSGFEVSAWDPLPERRSLATEASVAVAASADAVARGATILVTVLPGPTEFRDAVVGGGLLALLAEGGLWLDLTSNDPQVLDEVDALARSAGVVGVAAPMAGGPTAAEARGLRFFVGAEDDALERVRPILAVLGGNEAIEHIGPGIADGCTAKLLTNLLWFGQVVAVTEALLLGVSLGVPLQSLRRSLAGGAGGSVFIDDYLDALVGGDNLATFGIDRVVEELDTLVRLARRQDVPFELGERVAQLHRDALTRFGAIDGELLAARLLEERAGITLRESPQQ